MISKCSEARETSRNRSEWSSETTDDTPAGYRRTIVTSIDATRTAFSVATGDVAMPDACRLHRQRELQGELGPVIALQLPDRKRHRGPELLEERQARSMIQMTIKPQDAKTRAVVQCRVLKAALAVHANELHIDLNRIARLIFRKQAHLLGCP
jgi:hypothetical protein